MITLSGSVLFASNKFLLLPAAQVNLGEVADALLKGDPETTFMVAGHTLCASHASVPVASLDHGPRFGDRTPRARARSAALQLAVRAKQQHALTAALTTLRKRADLRCRSAGPF